MSHSPIAKVEQRLFERWLGQFDNNWRIDNFGTTQDSNWNLTFDEVTNEVNRWADYNPEGFFIYVFDEQVPLETIVEKIGDFSQIPNLTQVSEVDKYKFRHTDGDTVLHIARFTHEAKNGQYVRLMFVPEF